MCTTTSSKIALRCGTFIPKLLTLCHLLSNTTGYMIEMKNIEHCWKMHDECNHMVPQESRHGITNEFPHQVWHCNCALEFYLCLHHINSTLSGRIGELFFTANAKCYRYNYQAIECLIYDEDQRAPQSKRCVQYLLDLDQPSKMQWFDLPFYSGKPPQGPMFTSLKTSKSL